MFRRIFDWLDERFNKQEKRWNDIQEKWENALEDCAFGVFACLFGHIIIFDKADLPMVTDRIMGLIISAVLAFISIIILCCCYWARKKYKISFFWLPVEVFAPSAALVLFVVEIYALITKSL